MFGDYPFNDSIEELVDSKVLILQKDDAVINVLYKMLQENFQEGLILFSSEGNERKKYAVITLDDLSISQDDLFDFDQKIEDKLPDPLDSLPYTTTVKQMLKVFDELKIDTLPIENNGELMGVVRKSDFLDRYFPVIYEMNHKYQEIINLIPEAVSVIDQNGYVKLWNRKAEVLHKIPEDKIINKKAAEFFPDGLSQKVLKSKQPEKNVHYAMDDDYYITSSSFPIYNNNKFTGVISTDVVSTEKHPNKHNSSTISFDDIKGLENQMESIEKAIIMKALETNNYNKSKTAKYLEIPRSTLYYKLEKHELE